MKDNEDESTLQSDSSSSSDAPNTNAVDAENEMQQSTQCRDVVLEKFENFSNLLITGWKYHVAKMGDIRAAWEKFENFYSEICSLANSDDKWITLNDSRRSEYANANSRRIVEDRCKSVFDERVNEFFDYFVTGGNWREHAEENDEIKEAWQEFENYFTMLCSTNHCKF